MVSPRSSPWIAPSALANGREPARLVCFPFAGGGASTYRSWSQRLAPEIGVLPVELPGRETCFRERPFDRLEPLIAALMEALVPELDRPFALFGHSMGALLAFEVTRALRRRGGPMPSHLFVSARAAPDGPLAVRWHDRPDAALLDELRRSGGTPEAVLQSADFMAAILPVLRADLTLNETYAYSIEPPLDIPLTALAGTHDPIADVASVHRWRAQTSGRFALRVFEGHHFFLRDAEPHVLRLIARDLKPQGQNGAGT